MRLKTQTPALSWQDEFLEDQKQADYSYQYVEGTKGEYPQGFDHDRNKVLLGEGEECFAKAKQGIQRWSMFPPSWTMIFPKQAPIQENTTVGMAFRLFGIWWINSCRIVYTIDEKRRFGFAYGTLPEHIERGEELFLVEIDEEDKVWYHIQAFSKPRHWLVRLGYWFARSQQRRFVQHSFKVMKAYCSKQHV
jgi:uncharacterized protein (UPF0548 family)